jgi:hypothetical protein
MMFWFVVSRSKDCYAMMAIDWGCVVIDDVEKYRRYFG